MITKLLKIAGLMIDHMPLRKINPLHTDVDVIKQTAMFRNKMMATDSSSNSSSSSSDINRTLEIEKANIKAELKEI